MGARALDSSPRPRPRPQPPINASEVEPPPEPPCPTCCAKDEEERKKDLPEGVWSEDEMTTVDVTVPEADSFGDLDKAGIAAAEDAMRANPDLQYVGITARGTTADGFPMTSNGGWTRAAMDAGSAHGGALLPNDVGWYPTPTCEPSGLLGADGL